jgi:hypothetical protein
VEPKPAQTRVVPESALLHFAFTQRQWQAVHAAVAYFARKLQDPRQREQAQSALAVLMTPAAYSLPSEAEEAAVGGGQRIEDYKPDAVVPEDGEKLSPKEPWKSDAPPRGIAALRGGKK